MSDISTDLEDIANQIPAWESPSNTYKYSDVPKTEFLRVTALCMVVRFRELREKWYESNRRADKANKERDELKSLITELTRYRQKPPTLPLELWKRLRMAGR